MVRAREAELRRARLEVDPARHLLASLALPPLLAAAGWLLNPGLAAAGLLAGLAAPRLHIRLLASGQQRRAESEAGRLLSAISTNLGGGATYYDALLHAREAVRDRHLREDIAHVLAQFNLDRSMADAVRDVRRRTRGRNLALVWDQLAICLSGNGPAARARTLIADLAGTVQFNEQLAREVRARTSGQRAQIWLLAVVVPALYAYLRLMSPELLSVLDDTVAGRYLLLPAGASLEVLGIWLSLRLSRVEV
jgi:Flp pilus assembly protein TadB